MNFVKLWKAVINIMMYDFDGLKVFFVYVQSFKFKDDSFLLC